ERRPGGRARQHLRPRARRDRPPRPAPLPASPAPRCASPPPPSFLHPEHREERFLRDLDLAYRLHPLLAFLLLLEELALAGDVAAVALGEHVLAQRLLRLAGDHARADGGLDGHLVHLPGDLFLQLLADGAPALVGALAVHDG